ncbi:purine permease 21-like [Impatiens glandulifera]|uniref:purine permease 21-like n=1 Tax=Impatiens glandulifera TaxID=253017 RepID=UPI001FB0BEEB|nr:purine permease 21-like [Impatiens glandulifera]
MINYKKHRSQTTTHFLILKKSAIFTKSYSTVQEALKEYPKNQSSVDKKSKFKGYLWWVRMAIYTAFVLFGQAIAVILGRLYFDKGGNSKWIATLVQTSGFPILIPFLFIKFPKTKSPTSSSSSITIDQISRPPSLLTLSSLYIFLGIFLAADCMLYSIGLVYLPVSTYSLICASQLGFNALFSFFLNAQKLTPFIINSLVLLTLSSVLLVFQPDSSESNKVSKGKYILGFLATVGASAGYALMLSVTQLAFRKILKKDNLRVVFDMIIYQSLFATLAIMIGLFASGEWRWFGKEINEFELGKVAYVMTLVWTAIFWQVFSIGAIGLIFEISSLFSNVISTLGLPVVPVLAVFIFRDKMDGVKVISMVLAIWGFVSYIYQHYIDDLEMKKSNQRVLNDGLLQNQEQLPVELVERSRN